MDRCITLTARTYDDGGWARIEAAQKAATVSDMMNVADLIDWRTLDGKDMSESRMAVEAPINRYFMDTFKFEPLLQLDIRNIPAGRSFVERLVWFAYWVDLDQRLSIYGNDIRFCNMAMEFNVLEDRDDFYAAYLMLMWAYAKAKLKYPNVQFFVSFLHEAMIERDSWKMYEQLSFMDLAGVSSYPVRPNTDQVGDPYDLPRNYYSQIARHTKKQIIFTELGWPTQGNGGSPENQAAFIGRLPKLFRGLTVLVANWYFLWSNKGHGDGKTSLFDWMGIMDNETGNEHPGFEAFANLS